MWVVKYGGVEIYRAKTALAIIRWIRKNKVKDATVEKIKE